MWLQDSDSGCGFDIQTGQTAGAVSGKAYAHLSVADIDVGMMVHLFGDFSHLSDELQGQLEAWKLKPAFHL